MRILLVEDDRDLSSAITRALKFAKYDVECAYDGLTGLKMAFDYEIDLIIADVMMPRMDGFSMVKAIREKGSSVPILMLTAKGEVDDKVEGLDAGADDYMAKPFQIRELLARVRALLRRSGEISQSYRYGDFTLSFDTFELIGDNGERARLTNKEYRLMETLVRNSKSVLSTERLMERVWDYDSEAEINVVWAYLSALRKKLDEIHSDYTIVSMRGVGYQLGEKK